MTVFGPFGGLIFILNNQGYDMSSKKFGDCFEVAANVVAYASLSDKFEEAMLVHGIVVGTAGPVKGVAYCHAWIELDGYAVDLSCGRDIKVDKDFYYLIGQINPEKVIKYTREETKNWLLKSKHYGPWELFSSCPCENLICEQEA